MNQCVNVLRDCLSSLMPKPMFLKLTHNEEFHDFSRENTEVIIKGHWKKKMDVLMKHNITFK